MDDKNQKDFKRCYTCGKWLPVVGAFSDRFCSRECAQSFKRCSVCGDYFALGPMTVDGFCSAECAGIDLKDRPETITEVE